MLSLSECLTCNLVNKIQVEELFKNMFNLKPLINFTIIFLEQAALSVQFVHTVDSA